MFPRAMLAAFVVALYSGAVTGARITSSHPYHLGMAGGTTLTITGEGFSEDQFSQFDPTLGNEVVLVNEADTIPCDVINYLTNTDRIVCSTRARTNTKAPTDYVIKVYVDGEEATGTRTVQYYTWIAPEIKSMLPLWSLPGQLVQMTGYFRTGQYMHLDATDPLATGSTSGRQLTKVFVGGVDCEMFNATTGELYQAFSSNSLTCRVKSKYVGPMNGTVYVTERGASVNNRVGVYVDSQDRLYMYHTHPGVSSVSPSTSSSSGGASITITGLGFDPSPGKTQVRVGGAECVVQQITDNNLTCRTPPQRLTGPAPGERGLLLEVFEGEYVTQLSNEDLWADLNSEHTAYTSTVLTTTKLDIPITSPSSGRISGYLHAPHDGNYSLAPTFTSGASMFFVAADGNPENKTQLYHWKIFSLQADTPAYLEIRFYSSSTTSFRLYMNDYNGKFSHSQSRMARDEEHRILLQHTISLETQRVQISDSSASLTFYLNGYTSDPVADASDTDQVKSAVLSLVEQQCVVQGDDPKFEGSVGFEQGEELPFGVGGTQSAAVMPYCGRFSLRMTASYARLFYGPNVADMVDVDRYRFVCFAVRGNIKESMTISFYWMDKWQRERYNDVGFNHGIDSTEDKWAYTCVDMLEVVEESWIKNNRETDGVLKTRIVYSPRPVVDDVDVVYIDEFAFVDQDISVVQTRPSALKTRGITVSDVEVSIVEGLTAYDVVFMTGNCAGDFPLLGLFTGQAAPEWLEELAEVDLKTFELDGGGSVVVNRTTAASHPLEGTWALTVQNTIIEGISPKILPHELQSELEGALDANGITVRGHGNCSEYMWYVRWTEDPGRKELATVDDSQLIYDGESLSLTTKRTSEGKIWHDPVDVDFLTVRRTDPQVAVSVNGYRASCLGDCSFTYSDADTPSLESMSSAEDGSGGYTLTVAGSGWTSTATSDYSVSVGRYECSVTAVTSSQVTCTVDSLPAGSYPVDVSMQPVGFALQPDPPLQLSISMSLTSVFPTKGGTGGGYNVTITGAGLPQTLADWSNARVKIASKECIVVAANSSTVTCTVPGATGSNVDVRVETEGAATSTLTGAFTYDPTLSAEMTSVSPTRPSVLGGNLTVGGVRFGSGDDGWVKVGMLPCEIVSWTSTSVTCTMPTLPPGSHPVTLYTGEEGLASGDFSVTSTLKVTSASAMRGSINGGTITILRGEGFGSNCSLVEVSLGEGVVCDVMECSDTEITCMTKLVPVTHVISNLGPDSEGDGTSWIPKLAVVREGDNVRWMWSKPAPLSQLLYSVFQTSSAGSGVYDGSGFQSGQPTSSGSLTVSFPNAGTYYFASTPVEDLVMIGQVKVVNPAEEVYRVRLFLGGVEAEYDLSTTSVSVTIGGCGSLLDAPLEACNATAPLPPSPDDDDLYFISDLCLTPVITKIQASGSEDLPGLSGLVVKAGVTLTIDGSGFGESPCQTTVMVGQASCTVTASSYSSVTCTLDDADNMVSLKPFPVSLKVLNRGIASIDVANYTAGGQVSVVPVLTSFTPTLGSLSGGTTITITGSGLMAFDGVASVTLGSGQCSVLTLSPTTITCLTSPAPAGTVTLNVAVSAFQVPAITDGVATDFTFSSGATPSVTGVSISGGTLTITGSSFGSDPSQVVVSLSPAAMRRKRSAGDVELANDLPVDNTETGQLEALSVDEESLLEEVSSLFLDDEDGMLYEDAEGPRIIRIPKVHSHLFDKIDGVSDFWGVFTHTSAKSYQESIARGAWRVGGSLPSGEEEPVLVVPRVKRQAPRPFFYNCEATSASSTQIVCSAPGLPAGSYILNVTVGGFGTAALEGAATTIAVVASVSGLAPTEGSVHGGALLNITGFGFTPGDVSVTLDGAECQIEDETVNSVTCYTPPHGAGGVSVVVTQGGGAQATAPSDYTYTDDKTPLLTDITPNTGVTQGTVLTLTGTRLMLGGGPPQVLVGGEECEVTAASDTSIACVAPDLAGGSKNVVARDAVYGNSNTNLEVSYDLSISSVSPAQGGFGGAEIVVTGTGFDPEGRSNVSVCDLPCAATQSFSYSITCIVPPPQAPGSDSTVACDVTVTNPGGRSTTSSDGFTYDDSLTPSIGSIDPARGGTAGGTTLRITGSKFASSGNNVTIGGSECVVVAETPTEITCFTGAHQGPGEFPVVVNVPAAGIATTGENSAAFFYIDRWSSIFTWGGGPVPSAGELVVIEQGQTILLDGSTDVLKMLLIKGGHVVFDREADSEIVLRAEYILIVEGGSLSVGSQEEPYTGLATIELHGNIRSIELPNYGAKVLAVRNGTLDLHGAPVALTWTHLASTAPAGTTTITLKQPVTWKAGDRIVIATTEMRFMKNENEERTISSVSPDGLTLTLDEPLEYEHLSIQQTLGGRTIETRAEVGLLTRNVRIRGSINEDFVEVIEACDENWNPGQFATQSCFNGRFGEELGSDQFGATVMLFGKFPDQDLVQGRIEYVEVTEAGQAFQLGRYPLHFHLVGNVNTSYIRGCSVHRTYNRAITIHAANNLTVERNVVYDNMGHAIFTEDGVEQNNVIQYNLAIFTRSSSSLLNVDVTPSAFWIVNPNNIVRHNAAAGGTHFGYWYRTERNPSGPSTTRVYCQNNERMGQFYNNTAHSMGWYGLWVFSMDGYYPKSGTCSGSDLVATWNDFIVWRCERGAEIVRGGALQFHNFVTLDNEKAGVEMVKTSGAFGRDNGPGIFDSFVIGYSALTPGGCSSEMSGVVAPKQYVFSVANTTFVNYDSNMCAALSGCSQCKLFQGGFPAQVMQLAFVNAPNKLKFKWEHETIWIDADGSLSGAAENVVVPSMGILPPDRCQMDVPQFSVNPEAPGAVCSPPIKFLRFNVEGKNKIEPSSLMGRDLIVSNSYGNTSVPYRVKRLTIEGWMGILYTGETYKWAFDYSSQITNITYDATTRHIEPGDYYYVEHEFMQTPDGFGTTGEEMESLESIPDPSTAAHGDYYWDEDARKMTYIVMRSESRRKRTVFDDRKIGTQMDIDFRVYRCQYEGCVPPTVPPVPTGRPDTYVLWSDNETWKNETDGSYNIPGDGDDVTVPPGMWLVVDKETPRLGTVFVYGVLEFDDTMDHDFVANIIFIQGGRVKAGESETEPFSRRLTITLRGSLNASDPNNEDMPMPPGVPNVGWKAIGVFGQLSLYGQDTGKSWVKLGATAAAGATQITLSEAVDPALWLNKQVMVTTSGKDVKETEIRTVTAVSGTTLTLDSALTYEHLGAIHTLADGSRTYRMASEVGILTRNVVVQGNVYPGSEDDSFGGRILVSQLTSGDITYTGQAQLYNVELRNMGQEGFTDTDDPRYSLAFHGLGADGSSSFVRKCSFNKNYNTAIGIFTSNTIAVEDNVVYHTVGSCIRDESSGNIFKNNLVSVMLFTGTYNGRRESQNQNWFAGFSLNKAAETTVEGNVVAGSEQAGFQTYGEHCDDRRSWFIDNEVHGVIYGVLLWKKGASGPVEDCRRLNHFYVWRAWDTAFYMQHSTSFLLRNATVVDCEVGVNQLVYAPRALSHEYFDKVAAVMDSVFVGASPSHSCAYQDSKADIESFYSTVLWSFGGGGNVGVMFASFMSSANLAPKHEFHAADNYPALRGATYILNVTFANYKTRSCGKDVAMITNRDSDDAIHPVFVENLSFLDSPEDNHLFMHEPNLGRVNPSDCVDMDCDGAKKVVIEDMDGSFLGTRDATAISQAEFEWDGDRSRGVGDYRIPVSLRTNTDGSVITAPEKFPNKGIVRDSSCSLVSAWRAWRCTNLRHRMMVIESMDADTEVRRLSPIALIANPGVSGYVDLLNGPMDRGWCEGYTCQERISTFYSIVAANTVYEMAMTSTPPQMIRFHLLHSKSSEAVVLRIFFPKTQRYDVYVDDQFVPPTNIDNSRYPASYQLIPADPNNPAAFFPTTTDVVGSNYLEREAKLLHVVLRGGHVIDIKTTPVIILSLGIVADPDNFFEEDVVRNMALLLNVPPENIRITNIIREDSVRRRKRSTDQVVQVESEIGGPPSASANSSNSEPVPGSVGDTVTYDELTEKAESLINNHQAGDSGSQLSIARMTVVVPDPPAEDPGPPATQEVGSVILEGEQLFSDTQQQLEQERLEQSLSPEEFAIPESLELVREASTRVKALTPFPSQPVVSALDSEGNVIRSLGLGTDPWRVTATLTRGPEGGVLMGTTSVEYRDGSANFTDLHVNKPGSPYMISFSVTHPSTAPDLSVPMTAKIRAKRKRVSLAITSSPNLVQTDESFNLSLVIIDRDTHDRSVINSSVLQGQNGTGQVLLQVPRYISQLQGPTQFTVQDEELSNFTIDGLTITNSGVYKYEVRLQVLPVLWNIAAKGRIFVVPTDNLKTMEVKMVGRRSMKRFLKDEDNRRTFSDSLLEAVKRKIGPLAMWEDEEAAWVLDRKPSTTVTLFGDTRQVINSALRLCKRRRTVVRFDCKKYPMVSTSVFVIGREFSCPRNRLTYGIFIEAISKLMSSSDRDL